MAPQISFFIIFLFLHINILWCASSEDQKQLIRIKELFSTKSYQDVLSITLPIKNKNSTVCMIISACYKELGKMTIAQAYLEKAYVLGNYRQKLKIIKTSDVLGGKASFVVNTLEDKEKKWHEVCAQKLLFFVDIFPMFLFQFLLLLFLFLLLYVVSNKYMSKFFVLFCAALLSGTIIIKYRINRPYAISLQETKMYSAPEDQAPIVGIVAENNRVYYTEERYLFYKIETLDKKRGWVYKDTMMPII